MLVSQKNRVQFCKCINKNKDSDLNIVCFFKKSHLLVFHEGTDEEQTKVFHEHENIQVDP